MTVPLTTAAWIRRTGRSLAFPVAALFLLATAGLAVPRLVTGLCGAVFPGTVAAAEEPQRPDGATCNVAPDDGKQEITPSGSRVDGLQPPATAAASAQTDVTAAALPQFRPPASHAIPPPTPPPNLLT